MKYIVTLNQKRYEVVVERGEAEIIREETITAPALAPAQAVSVSQATQTSAPAAQDLSGGTVIKAPMPGNIVDVKVTPGQSVKSGEVIAILEAMKMENEIVAPTDGKIVKVLVEKNTQVASGDAIAVLG